MKIVYLLGNVSGSPIEDVIEKFEKAEQYFLNEGYEVINPAKPGGIKNVDIIWDLPKKTDKNSATNCPVIVLMPYWHENPTAVVELYIAQKLDYRIIYWEELKSFLVTKP